MRNSSQNRKTPLPIPTEDAYDRTKLTYKIIDVPNHTYAYHVLVGDRLIIHQKTIPALSGNKGFKSKVK